MSLTRRYFLQIAAAAGATAVTPQFLHAQEEPASDSPNERIRAAVIGCGGRGGSHVSAWTGRSDIELATLCDTDTNQFASKMRAIGRGGARPEPKTEQDFRRVLDDPSIDIVSIATPNHWHSLIAILAMQAGKHVYSEKPISHNVWEGRQLVKWSEKLGKLCQCGTQARSSRAIKAAHDYVHKDKKLGELKYVIGTCYKRRDTIGKLDEPLKIPESVDYNMWCGPAKMVDLYRPKLHYDWHWDFNTGNGDMGNQGIHQMDLARWFINVPHLSPRVMSIGGRVGYDDAGNTPNTQIVYHGYEKAPLIFETRGLPSAAGGRRMDSYRGSDIGDIVQCENGYVVLTSNYGGATAYDNDGAEIESWRGAGDHFYNFIDAVRANDRSMLNADCLDGHLSSALCHTGAISHMLGKTMPDAEIREQVKENDLWADSYDRMAQHLAANNVDINDPKLSVGPWLDMDPATERFTNNEAANALLTREYREGFVVPSADA